MLLVSHWHGTSSAACTIPAIEQDTAEAAQMGWIVDALRGYFSRLYNEFQPFSVLTLQIIARYGTLMGIILKPTTRNRGEDEILS